jgi:hypothetical protein
MVNYSGNWAAPGLMEALQIDCAAMAALFRMAYILGPKVMRILEIQGNSTIG